MVTFNLARLKQDTTNISHFKHLVALSAMVMRAGMQQLVNAEM